VYGCRVERKPEGWGLKSRDDIDTERAWKQIISRAGGGHPRGSWCTGRKLTKSHKMNKTMKDAKKGEPRAGSKWLESPIGSTGGEYAETKHGG